jgi:glycosyltransferase involved in cell wall biosynthesis
MTAPLVSIIIPCHNHAEFVSACIESALGQKYERTELVVVDDGSIDDSLAACRQYADRAQVIGQQNAGVAAARNRAVAAASGEYFVPLDADDLLHPECVATAVRCLLAAESPKPDFLQFGAQRFGSSEAVPLALLGAPVGLERGRRFDIGRLLTQNIGVCSGLIPKAAWSDVGGYREDGAKGGMEDWDFWLRLVGHGYAGRCMEEILYFYRLPSENSRYSITKREYSRHYRALIEQHREFVVQRLGDYAAGVAALKEELIRERERKGEWEELYWQVKPGRLERWGVPVPLAALARKLFRRVE